MMYRAKCTNCLSQLKNLKAYEKAYICADSNDIYIEVDTEEEAEKIEQLNKAMNKSLYIYNELIDLTIKLH